MIRAGKGVLALAVFAMVVAPSAANGGERQLIGGNARTVPEAQFLEFTVRAVGDPEGDLRYTPVNLPAGVSFDVDTEKFAWVPNYDQAGTYSVQFAISDGTSATVTITVIDVPVAPGAALQAATTTKVRAKVGPERIRARGTVTPAQPGSRVKVTLLRKDGRHWEPQRSVRVSLVDGADFKARFPRPAHGRCAVGASFRGDLDALPSSATSRAFEC